MNFNTEIDSTLYRALMLIPLVVVFALTAYSAQTDIIGPAGSGTFGDSVTALPNGNFVVVDTRFDLTGPAVSNVGSVYLYDGTTLAVISRLIGGSSDDSVGSGGITVLTNGNFVVRTTNWDNPSLLAADAGAVTWCSAVTGCNGTVSATNSLVGGISGDRIGTSGLTSGITVLTNGNYVVSSSNWRNPRGIPIRFSVGAVTWGNGAGGTVGLVSSSNSLIGGTTGDQVGSDGITALTNGNYVVSSNNWDHPSLPNVSNVGAVTWGNGLGGTVGLVSSSNSLVGGTANDQIGAKVNSVINSLGVTPLTNGNYVVSSPFWNNPSPLVSTVGAVTWGNGLGGTVGLVSSSNSLVGSSANDFVGYGRLTALTNGNYVVSSFSWDNPSPLLSDVGAVTWGNGLGGTVGLVSSSNSLVGSTAGDSVGVVTSLTNGHYVVSTSSWDNPSPLVADVGAVTWGNGSGGTIGLITSGNSLVGGAANDNISYIGGDNGITALANGNYVVTSSYWDNPSTSVADVGAVTWGNGAGGTVGLVTSGNSLVGGTLGDAVGRFGVTALTNGNYVVRSPGWDNPSPLTIDVGAVTWGNGAGGTVGLVTPGNSLVGGTANDSVGVSGITALTNGNYVVGSVHWDNPSPFTSEAGAVTWCNGASGTIGFVTSANSLVGGTQNDSVGYSTALTNGNYVVSSPTWRNPSPVMLLAGANTWGNGNVGTVGVVTSANSLVGGTAFDHIGNFGVKPLSNGNYVFGSPEWDNPSPLTIDAGAVTYGKGSGGTAGLITSANSVRGTQPFGVSSYSFDALRNRIIVGRGASNAVSIFSYTAATFDFDGDGKTDPSVYRPGPGEWWWLRSSNSGNGAVQFGVSTDTVAAADYTGDGKTDVALFRPSTGFWYILRSEDFSFYAFPFGGSGDIPAPADFDGDGKADAAIFRPSNSTWYILNSGGGTTITQFGANGDLPVAADYDGDGKADIAVYRPTGANGAEWWISKSGGGTFATQFGLSTDKAVAADYTGDGKADIAFWRPATGEWYILRSEDYSFFAIPFGSSTDIPTPGDYDGDGKADAAVFRPSNSTWYANRSTAGVLIQQFGQAGDLPLPNAFVR